MEITDINEIAKYVHTEIGRLMAFSEGDAYSRPWEGIDRGYATWLINFVKTTIGHPEFNVREVVHECSRTLLLEGWRYAKRLDAEKKTAPHVGSWDGASAKMQATLLAFWALTRLRVGLDVALTPNTTIRAVRCEANEYPQEPAEIACRRSPVNVPPLAAVTRERVHTAWAVCKDEIQRQLGGAPQIFDEMTERTKWSFSKMIDDVQDNPDITPEEMHERMCVHMATIGFVYSATHCDYHGTCSVFVPYDTMGDDSRKYLTATLDGIRKYCRSIQ